MGQIAQKSHRIGEEKVHSLDLHAAGGGVERRKERVLYKDVRARERVQQRGFSRIRIADERHRAHAVFFSALCLQPAALLRLFQLFFKRADAGADMTAVRLELRFPRSARSDAAPETGERLALAFQAGIEIAELGKFHLQFALAALGAQGKDVEDERRAVDDLFPAQRLGEVDGLGGGELPVEEHRDVKPL